MNSDQDGVVTWVASQTTNPALRALMREAECEKKTRPSTPIISDWSAPLSYTARLPPSSSASSASSSSLPPSGSDQSLSRRVIPLSASSIQPHRNSARPRSSHHSTAPSTHIPHEHEPEASTFVELLKDVSRQLDQNAHKKQRLVVRAREKERERSLGRCASTSLDTRHATARPLVKTSSASAICPAGSSTRAAKTCPDSFRHRHALERTASLGAPGVVLVSGKSTSTSLPNLNLNCNPKHLPEWSDTPSTKASTPDDGDSPMRDVIDLSESDTEWRHPPTSLADTMQIDDDDDVYGDSGMDISFYQPEPPPKPKPQPSQPTSRPPAPTQRARAGPPPLGMRRVQPSQLSSTQGPKGLTRPRFKPPLLANGGSGDPKVPPRGATKVAAKTVERESRDADSSFDVSFDMDPDALEETMKAYD